MSDCYENCKDIRNGVCPPMKSFCPKKLAEHDKQIRNDTIDECIEALGNNIWDIAKLEQLKDQNK